jgi:hypothetical protein
MVFVGRDSTRPSKMLVEAAASRGFRSFSPDHETIEMVRNSNDAEPQPKGWGE